MKKTLLEIVNMTDEELLEYYNSRELLNEGVSEMEDEFLGEMTEEELIAKYHLIPASKVDIVIDNMIKEAIGFADKR